MFGPWLSCGKKVFVQLLALVYAARLTLVALGKRSREVMEGVPEMQPQQEAADMIKPNGRGHGGPRGGLGKSWNAAQGRLCGSSLDEAAEYALSRGWMTRHSALGGLEVVHQMLTIHVSLCRSNQCRDRLKGSQQMKARKWIELERIQERVSQLSALSIGVEDYWSLLFLYLTIFDLPGTWSIFLFQMLWSFGRAGKR